MNEFTAELIGTMLLILLGNGVVANVVLKDTKGYQSGWIVITMGWGMAVFVAVFIVAQFSGAHINPAVTIGLAVTGLFDWAKVPMFILAQLLGAMLGSTLVWFTYHSHYRITENKDLKLATFCTTPAIRKNWNNFVSELIGTFVLVYGVLHLSGPSLSFGLEHAAIGLGSLDALPVGLLVTAIGLSLGGTTGYAINPARDLGPRIMHQLLPIHEKRNSNWGYAWIPVLGPIAGAVLAGLLFNYLG